MLTIKRRRSFLLRVAGATIVALAMWGFVSLSGSYEKMIELPVLVELPAGLTLTRPIPTSIRVVVRASGWSLLKTMIIEDASLVLRPVGRGVIVDGVIGYSRQELLERLRVSLPDAEGVNFDPDSLTLAFGAITSKRVPLVARASIHPRSGFQVIGAPWLDPDTVIIAGAGPLFESIDSWPTAPVSVTDVHGSLSQWANVSDSLHPLISIQPRRVELRADIQEIGERAFSDVPLIDRVTLRDSSLRLELRPSRVEVLVRGGVRDLSRLDPTAIRAYVEVVEGVDTLGILEPRLMLPPGVNVSIVRVTPERIRYVFRREG